MILGNLISRRAAEAAEKRESGEVVWHVVLGAATESGTEANRRLLQED
jgi:hypothetical protein